MNESAPTYRVNSIFVTIKKIEGREDKALLLSETYVKRIESKSPQLLRIEAKQKELNGEVLPEKVAKFGHSNR